MRKLFILISCLYSAVLFGQTNVSGLINSNTTWDLTGSPYIVNGNLAVNAGVTLTIEAGVQVKLDSDKSILMNGELIAIGSAGNEILFTSNAANPEKGDWGTLICSINATPAVYDADGNYLDGSILQHVILEYGGGNNTDGQLVVDGAPFMDHIVSRYSETRGVYAESLVGDIRLVNSEIHSNEWQGIYINSYSYYKHILNNEIHANDEQAVYIRRNGKVQGNHIHDNARILTGESNFIIAENFICNNNGGIDLSYNNNNNDILNNIIVSNSGSNYLLQGNFNTIQNNIIADNEYSEIFRIYNFNSFTNNHLTNNKADQSIIALYGGNNGDIIKNNSFYGNEGAVSAFSIYMGGNSGVIQFIDNNLFDRSTEFLYNNQNNSNTTNVNAQSNYWGTTNTTEIDDLIYDFFDDFNQGLVDYSAYLTAPNIDAPISAPANVTKMDLGANGIKLTWASNNIESDHAGYKIYWGYDGCSGFTNSSDLGNVNTYTLTGVAADEIIAISAYDNLADETDDLFEGHESWYSFAELVPSYPELTIKIKESVVRSGEQVCIPVQVYNFENIGSLTYSIEYDENYLTYTGANNLNLANLSASDIANPAAGQLTLSWMSDDASNGTTVANATSIYEVCFDVSGPHFTSTAVEITDSPTTISATDATGNNITVDVLSAEVLIIDQFTIEMPDVIVEAGEQICLPVSVYMLEDVYDGRIYLDYNNEILEPAGVANEAFNIYVNDQNSYVRLRDNDNGYNELNLNDGEVLIELCFNVIGAPGDYTDLNVNNSYFNYGQISPIFEIDGSITIIDNSACENDTIAPEALCQDVTVSLNNSGVGSTTADFVNNGSNDLCGISSLVLSQTNFDCNTLGANTVTLTVTDSNTNESSCSAVVTVVDQVTPVALCQDVTIFLDATGLASTTATAVNNGSSDNCGLASLSLSQTAFDCTHIGTTDVTLTATDNNTNSATCDAVVTVIDNTAPTAQCLDAIVELDANGFGTLLTSDVDNGSTDACGIANLELSQTDFDCNHVGDNPVILTITDNNNNTASCAAIVNVQNNNGADCGSGSSYEVAGVLTTQNAEAIEAANVEVNTGLFNQATDATGAFNFDLTVGGDYVVVPALDVDADNGVTTYDIFLLTRHILGVETFTSAYQMIAADANNSETITTLDAFQIRKVILQLDEYFPNNTSWRFVDADHVFVDALNPWGYPEMIQVLNLEEDQLDLDFTGVKVGDVNASSIPNLQAVAQDRTNGTLSLNAKDRQVQAGDIFTVELTADAAFAGCQFTLNYNNLELVSINDALANADNFGQHADALTMSWNDSAIRDLNGDVLVSLTFQATTDIKLSEVLTINSRYTKAEAYTAEGLEDVNLTFSGQAKDAYVLYQNIPNPFNGNTTIGFDMAEAGNASLEIRTIEGKVIESVEGYFNKGYNELTIKDLNTTGLLYYTLRTDDFSATKKMILVK